MKKKIKEFILSLIFFTWLEKVGTFFWDFISKHKVMGIGALLGGINILTFFDSIFLNVWNIPLPLPEIPFLTDLIRQLFLFFRVLWLPLTEYLAVIFPFELPSFMKNYVPIIKDYITMGVITGGMRLRSSFIIWKGVNNGSLKPYKQKTILRNKPVVLNAGECCKFWFLFLPIRLIYAFFAWPSKIIGATYRFHERYLRTSPTGEVEFIGEAEKVRKDQYMAFFSTILWAVSILLLVYLCYIVYLVYLLIRLFG